jgi:hypothetical protein
MDARLSFDKTQKTVGRADARVGFITVEQRL